jgi:hypothetical protein
MRYFFSDHDVFICQRFADSVNNLKTKYRATRKLNNNPHYLGKLGEVAFSKLFDLSVNFDVHQQGDAGYDFSLNDITVDVKTTKYWKYPELKEFPGRQLSADIYILVGVNLDELYGDVCGFITRKNLEGMQPTNYRDKGLRIVAKPKDLCRDWGLLQRYANLVTL